MFSPRLSFFFFFNDTATTEIYTLSLHDALPISSNAWVEPAVHADECEHDPGDGGRHPHDSSRKLLIRERRDRKSTRLNSSHLVISYAVFCLKKKNNHLLSICRYYHIYMVTCR